MLEQWKLAQEEEWECWSGLKEKLNSSRYFEEKIRYWKSILSKINLSKEDLIANKTLEVGCGPTGLFMLLKKDEKDNFFALDPLLDRYRSIVPEYLLGVQGYSCPVEKLDCNDHPPFDYIFAINCIDHCCNMDEFCSKLKQMSSSQGRIYLAVNTHKRDFTARVWRRFQKILEPLHPYHMTQNEYEEFLSKYFIVQEVLDIEREILEVNNKTKSIPNSQKGEDERLIQKVKNKVITLADKCRPASIIFGALSLLGLPAHDFHGVGNSIYRHKMFILRSN